MVHGVSSGASAVLTETNVNRPFCSAPIQISSKESAPGPFEETLPQREQVPFVPCDLPSPTEPPPLYRTPPAES